MSGKLEKLTEFGHFYLDKNSRYTFSLNLTFSGIGFQIIKEKTKDKWPEGFWKITGLSPVLKYDQLKYLIELFKLKGDEILAEYRRLEGEYDKIEK